MPNSNNGIFDPMAQYARLSERVENQGKDIVDLRSNMNTGFQSVNASIGTISNELRASIGTLSNELRANSETPWPVIWTAAGVCFVILSAIMTFVYGTLNKEQSRLDSAIIKSTEITQMAITKLSDAVQTSVSDITKNSVPLAAFQDFRSSYENNRIVSRQENIDKFGSMRTDIDKIKDDQVPRKEHERVWQSYDAQLAADREARIAANMNLQRQLDEVKQTQSGFFGQRDLNMQVLDRLERIERDRRQGITQP
ncbi:MULTISPECIES: hypothetical protein [unclassified Phyllobacterium]|uniref:hypothetical protein n=1 Tax=unclassified Phyllobacterium TaxID=2638441 RepID=UPI003012E359